MSNTEAQGRAIKLSAGDEKAESMEHMDHEGQVHTCPACGHAMPMDEVMARAGAEKLTPGDQRGLGGAHMDREGQVK